MRSELNFSLQKVFYGHFIKYISSVTTLREQLCFSVINQNVTFAETYYRDFMLKLSTLIMNVFISVRLGSLNIESCIDNILNHVSSTFESN